MEALFSKIQKEACLVGFLISVEFADFLIWGAQDMYIYSSNGNVHKTSFGLCFMALDPFIDRLKGLQPKNKGNRNLNEHCDLLKIGKS